MRLGINHVPEHRTPEEWGDILVAEGYRASTFPVDFQAKQSTIDAYVKAAKDRDILIAEVGVWCSPFAPDRELAAKGKERCKEQLRLADYVQANCCVNITGSTGDIWCGCYPDNFSEDLYRRNVELIQELCDEVKPKHTYYTLEPMQWMVPDSPEQYVKILKDVDRSSFAVHMDIINFIKDPYTYTHQGELIEKSFRLLGPKIRSCHLKDCLLEPGLTVAIHEVLLGTGSLDIQLYLDAIAQLDADMPVLLEHLTDMESYRKAGECVRKIWE